MINFKTKEGVFNFRTAGILIKDGKVLIHRMIKDDFYALPGGRVEMTEDTETTLIREMNEELNIEVTINRLLWVCESFFNHLGQRYHEICFYYLMDHEGRSDIYDNEVFKTVEENREYEFKWVSTERLKDEEFYPLFIKKRINDLPSTIERIVDREDI
ncbi:NUDIX hydrolase [Oceanirhabdus sp. W0125-5]|uniref:NUDIX hydrolase n=1 Tax=Oceanirhabdus sp. W0125-5 TaxID=2999116 RepID=UPI0022F2AD9F|nr:NUDIX hydrolase [Oceanirhabdus sp. W0125-5]WBW96953.1 NUDIX hydrolase [Oceanirhabdus sp. W0125-5]